MDQPPTSPRGFDIPKPEAGLAEWTSKIKAMQRQVDADDLAEQKRLEDEIAASRLARMRRSRGSRVNSVDLANSPEYSIALKKDDDVTTADDLKPIVERQRSQAEALHKLMGDVPSHETRTHITASRPPVASKKPESISLAAFMGGHATGPRLNRPAPQPDSHDPTQFQQRDRVKAPHPVFGRGGVAMPGMTIVGRSQTSSPRVVDKSTESSVRRAELERSETLGMPALTGRHSDKVEEHSVSSHWTGSRQRTISTPMTAHVQPTISSPPAELSYRPISQSYTAQTRPKTPTREPITSTIGLKTPPSSPPPASRPFTPRERQSLPVTPTSPPPAVKSAITTPSLARPIQPVPRPSSLSPQVPASQNPSPAFLRPPAQKDPSPSISRLQGRGFVQNMVKVSTQLESPSTVTSGSAPPSSDRSKNPNARRSSVLDRWPAASTSATSPPESPTPKSIPMRKSRTVDPTHSTPEASRAIDTTSKTLRPAPSLPSMTQARSIPLPIRHAKEAQSPPPDSGLGSATTMVLIKPTKTGDAPPTHHVPAATPRPEVDELGVRPGYHREKTALTSSTMPPPVGKPLIHPTKDRARKPKKARRPTPATTKLEQSADPVPISVTSSMQITPTSAVPVANHPLHDQVEEPSSQTGPAVDPSPSTSVVATKVGRLADRWAEQPIIGVKSIPSNKPIAPPSEAKPTGLIGRRALPGLTSAVQTESSSPAPSPDTNKTIRRPSTFDSTPPYDEDDQATIKPSFAKARSQALPEVAITTSRNHIRDEEPAPSPITRHARIPSTGNRATVMDVAQALNDSSTHVPETVISPSTTLRMNPFEQINPPSSDAESTKSTARPRNIIPPHAQAEKRKSSFEKYSAIMLPPLKEEITPVPSPAGTLSRHAGQAHLDGLDAQTLNKSLEDASPVDISSVSRSEPSTNTELVHFDHVDEPLPSVDVRSLVNSQTRPISPDLNIQTISVDVMGITGNTASAISRDTDIFYDTELLAIIHRSKSKSSGLVSTSVWNWRGRQCQVGEREQRKLQELAKRYGSTLTTVCQYLEPLELVQLLGGQLIIRQGTRAHWTSENTAMHLVRSINGVTFIDEYDLDIKYLCSGYSYCLSILETIYVWHGCGSLVGERRAAIQYAQNLAAKGADVIELTEGENDDDEMFWMILGEEEFAKADYWKWRHTSSGLEPRIWRFDADSTEQPVLPVDSTWKTDSHRSDVYLIDCIWELFVLIGRDARGKRRNIRLAMSVAMDLSSHVASDRPYTPTVHVLILPTRLPLDLRMHFRGLDEAVLNEGEVPDHMNILSSSEALENLQKRSWGKIALKDHAMLPIGLDPSSIS